MGGAVAAVGAVAAASGNTVAPVFASTKADFEFISEKGAASVALGVDINALRLELLNDPQGLGYSNFIGGTGISSNHLAALINARNPAFRFNTGKVSAADLMAAIDQSEFDTLTSTKARHLQILMSTGDIDISDARIRAQIGSMFGGASQTRQNLIAAGQRDGSRAEQLFGTNVTRTDVSKALAS